MKEISNISKSFICECGTTNKFEFETDFDVHDIRMTVRCQVCGRERTIELMNFFRKHSSIIQPGQPTQVSEYDQRMNQIASPELSFNNMVSDYNWLPTQDNNSNLATNTNNDLQRTNPTDFTNILVPAQVNAMSMFEEQNISQSQPSPQAVQPQNQYAGLLDLEQEHLDNVKTLEEDGIYEPFGKESENAIFKQETEPTQTQTNALNPASVQLAVKIDEEENDEETFSALFGNL